jgi:hypothetical protein
LCLHYVSFEAKHWRASGYMNTEINSPRVSFLIIFPSFTFSLSPPLGLNERIPPPQLGKEGFTVMTTPSLEHLPSLPMMGCSYMGFR